MGPALELAPAASVLLAATAFANGFVRLRRRGRADLAGWDRAALFGVALVLWLAALSPPVDDLADRLLSAHMLQHVLIGDAAPALTVVALRGPLLLFVLPRGLLRRLARVRVAFRPFRHPAVAFAIWATSLGVWHVPVFYDAAEAHPPLHVLEHATFVLGGVLVWTQLVRGPLGARARLGYVLLVFLAGMVLTNVLILSYRPIYPSYAEQPDRLLGLSPLADQNAAALVMLFEQLATLGTFTAIMLRRWLREPLVLVPARHPFVA